MQSEARSCRRHIIDLGSISQTKEGLLTDGASAIPHHFIEAFNSFVALGTTDGSFVQYGQPGP